MPQEADLVLAGGPVLTVDPDEPEVDAVAFRDGRVTARGRAADVLVEAGGSTRVVDVDGGTVCPGFVDAHVHPVDWGIRAGRLDLSPAGTRDEALAAVADAADEARPDGWVVAYGWDESRWASGDPLTRRALDGAAPEAPVLAVRADRHLGAANTAALEALDVDARGHPEGHLTEEALFQALEAVAPGGEGLVDAVERFTEAAHARGVTAVHGIVGADGLAALDRACEAGALGVRVRAYLLADDVDALPGARPEPDPWLRLQGLKAFADGSIGARTAALREPYEDAPDQRGELLADRDELVDVAEEAGRRGLQVAVHAIGDRAVEVVLDAYEAADLPPGTAPRVEHAELLPPDGLERFRALGAVASCQPNFVDRWARPGGLYEARLGPERTASSNPYPALRDAGVPLAFGSDGMPFGPLDGLPGAVAPPRESHRLDPLDALAAYTRDAARAADDTDLGVLEPGARADAVVLSDDPRQADPGSLDVVLTVSDGEVVHDARPGEPG